MNHSLLSVHNNQVILEKLKQEKILTMMNLKKETINPNEMKMKDELFLQGITQAAADDI